MKKIFFVFLIIPYSIFSQNTNVSIETGNKSGYQQLNEELDKQTNPEDINERTTIEGALKNLYELSKWVSYDYNDEVIKEEEASMYYSLIEIVITQLESIQNSYKTDTIK